MLSRLPITVAQLQARNNSQKLKNEIRQLLYSQYRSKKLTKKNIKTGTKSFEKGTLKIVILMSLTNFALLY